MPSGEQVPCRLATGFWERLRGLLGTRPSMGPLPCPDLLVFPRCRSIHTVGMAYPIDVAFLDGRGIVLGACKALGPGHMASCPGASCAVEREASLVPWVSVGDRLGIREAKGVNGEAEA